MSSPPSFDPYLALGVSKEADLSAVRGAHRKLVLKFHPDRIKDEAERVKGREEFQKVQQAYELLSDPIKRSRYDDRVKLAEMKKEAMGRDHPMRAPSYFNSTAPFSADPEFRDGHYYQERAPMGQSFFDDEDRYREEPVRTASRKGDSYERRPPAGYSDKKTSGWKAGGMPINIALKLQKRAAVARDRVQERDVRTSSAKSRDQGRRRDATDKHQDRRAYVEVDSDSGSDTATYASVNRPTVKTTAPSSVPPPLRSHPNPTRNEPRHSDDEPGWAGDKHQVLHASACDYIERTPRDRPRPVPRQESSYSYYETKGERSLPRRGDNDRDEKRMDRERTKPSRSRRPSFSEAEPPRDVRSRRMPGMPTTNSAPAKILIPEHTRDPPPPHRSSTAQPARDHRKDIPSMSRSSTMPHNSSSRRADNVPSRGSNLKHAENQDSGYGSSSPATPDMSGTSPNKYSSATRYQIVDEDEEYSRGHRTIRVEPEATPRPSLSTAGTRSQASRAATAYTPRSPVDLPPTRPSPSRHESTRPSAQSRESSHVPRASNIQRDRKHMYRELPTDEDDGYKRRVSSEKMVSPRVRAQDLNSSSHHQRSSRDHHRDDDYYPGSKYKSDLRNPNIGRRPSVY